MRISGVFFSRFLVKFCLFVCFISSAILVFRKSRRFLYVAICLLVDMGRKEACCVMPTGTFCLDCGYKTLPLLL